AEDTHKFTLQPGNWLNFNWTPNGRFLAAYQDNGHAKEQLELFDLSGNHAHELESPAHDITFTQYFWMPDNQAIALVSDQDRALIDFDLKRNHSETLVSSGFKELLSTIDYNHYLYLRQEVGHFSLQRLNLENYEVSLIRDNIAYLWPARQSPLNDSYFVIEKN